MPAPQTPDWQVIVAGAGPVGLVTALRLVRAGVRVLVLERELEIPPQAKATHFAPPAVLELQKAGVLDDCRKHGFTPGAVCWRHLNLDMIGAIGLSASEVEASKNPLEMVCIPQQHLAKICIEHATQLDHMSVLWGRRVVRLEQDERKVWVTAEVDDGSGGVKEEVYEASYMVGADGGRSAVRKLIGQHLDGWTWDDQIVATNIEFPFHDYGLIEANFIVHPESMVMFAKISKEPEMWRVTYGEVTGLTDEQLRDRLLMKFNEFMPGPRPITEDSFKLHNFAPYRIHQRCVEHFRVGRVCLAGDAAHLVNPFGGTGLTGGLIDGGGLADCLIGIFTNRVDSEFILDKYDKERRRVFDEYTNPVSTANKQRMRYTDEEILKDPFIDFLRTATDEEKVQGAKGAWAMQHDFTQYYDSSGVA